MSFSTLSYHARGASVSLYKILVVVRIGGVPSPTRVTVLQLVHKVDFDIQLTLLKKAVFAMALNTRILCDPATVKQSCRPHRDTLGDAGFRSQLRVDLRLGSGFRVITNLIRMSTVGRTLGRVAA